MASDPFEKPVTTVEQAEDLEALFEGVFPEYIGGIPSYVLRPGMRGNHPTLNNREVAVVVDRTTIIIDAVGSKGIKFTAHLYHENDTDGPLCIGFDMRTKDKNGVHDPDYRGAALFNAAMVFFGLVYGQPIDKIIGKWGGDSDNLAMFDRLIAQFGPNPSEEQKLAVANAVWTGQQATAHHYFATSVKRPYVNGCEAVYEYGAPEYRLPAQTFTP